MLIDAHCHLEPELPVDGLLASMDRVGVDQAVLIAGAQAPIPRVPRAGTAIYRACLRVPALRMPIYRTARRSRRLVPHVRPDNEPVLAAARSHPDRFIPFAFLNPTLGQEVHDELDRALAEGARGVKLHLWFHEYRLTDALAVLRRCQENDLPVLAHLGFGPPEDVEEVLDRLPRLKLILAHAGIPHFHRLWRLERVRFDVAGLAGEASWVPRGFIPELLEAVGPDRVVFGSDAPIGIRTKEGHAFALPPLPDRALGASVLELLG